MRGKTTADLTGQKFARLLVVARDPERSRRLRSAYWKCRCDCGNTAYASSTMLRNGQHKSCGCLKTERTVARSTKHGNKPRAGASRTYNSWVNMLRRCENPDYPRYADWGGRGITVCARWHDFAAFLDDMGEKPPGLTLERKNNNGPYSPDNCCWDTYHAQRINRRTWLTPEARQVILDMRARGCLLREIGESLGVSRQAISRALRSQQRSKT